MSLIIHVFVGLVASLVVHILRVGSWPSGVLPHIVPYDSVAGALEWMRGMNYPPEQPFGGN